MSGEVERCFPRGGSGLTYQHEIGWKGLPGEKHSSLLRTYVNYGHTSFVALGPERYSIWVGSSLAHKYKTS
jgi:hypothetical protein